MKLNPYLKDFWTTKAKIKILYGGRASSKTEDTAGILIYLASKYKLRIACIRKFQANIKQSVYSVIKKKVELDPYFKKQYIFTETSIKTEVCSEFMFLGWQRNTDQIKGLDDIDIVWLEEGHTLTKEQWQIISDTVLLRKDDTMVIVVFNPYLDTDFIYNNFIVNKKDDVLVKKINYVDNLFLPKTARKFIENQKVNMEDEEFNHVYMGEPLGESEDAFIKRAWIDASIDAHIKLDIEIVGTKTIGYDVADSGADKCATVIRHGILTTNILEWKAKENELEESAEKVYYMAKDIGANINYDCIGVGASAGSTFRRLGNDRGYIEFNKFDAGAKVDNPDNEYQPLRMNKDHFENLKSQAWQDIADRFRSTYNAVVKGKQFNGDEIISISSDCINIDELKTELSSPKKDRSKRGLVKVESKEDMKKRNISSPNLADAFIMSYYRNRSFIDYDKLLNG